ncbi:PD-(D/E)XK nuclease family protein [Azonexus sp.]|uniref:PD-(D/E)XK nuclease family protein n=1 Tax=Azonexus sp. TaxID=1872668 RepID=UPI0035B1A217
MSETLYLCATARLAQTLRQTAPAAGAVWRTPLALTLGQWLAELADAALLAGEAVPQLLDADAERLLWEQVVAEALAGGVAGAALFDLAGLAASAQEAHALCREWGLTAGGDGDESRLFADWQARFLKRCRSAGWIDGGGLQHWLIERLNEGAFTLPERVVVAGFDRPTPLERQLFEALAGRGVGVEMQPLAAVASQIEVRGGADAGAECHAVAAWVGARLAADPQARLGIVAPDLAGVRDRLAGLLDEVLLPAALRPDAADLARPYNISLGRPFAELPVVRSALELLAVAGSRGSVEQTRLSALLLGGFWAGAEDEADARARLDAAQRRRLGFLTTPAALLRLGERLELPCPRTLAALAEGNGLAAAAPRSQRPAAWGRHFRQLLAALGWPGERALSSHEFQARRAFLELLDGFGRLDGVLGSIGAATALARLRDLCRHRVFQPETRGRPAVQVLGVLESAGLEFDALWVMGMNDDRWPPPPRPNPLLPAAAQRAAGSAHASAEVELDFARRVQARLLRSAPQLIFSFAQADGNRLLRPSPLLAELAPAQPLTARVATLASRLALADRRVALADAMAPPLAPGETVPGGSWLLRAQAICPAWAFYRFRLAAQALEAPVDGLDPAARGTLVHAALEAFWRACGGSEALAAQDATARTAAIAGAVATALARFEQTLGGSLPARFRQLEGARLGRLLERWLALEAERPQPFTVAACEQAQEVAIEGIRVKVVADRIDRLEDGRQLIIDYKTGASIDVRNWASERLSEPQLPIYAALVADDVAGVAFAKVLADKPAFTGVADAGDLLPGVAGLADGRQKLFDPARFPDWPAVLEHWRARLQAVAREVGAGVAGVVFADEAELRYCEVLPLLRLPERRQQLTAAQAGVPPAMESG